MPSLLGSQAHDIEEDKCEERLGRKRAKGKKKKSKVDYDDGAQKI